MFQARCAASSSASRPRTNPYARLLALHVACAAFAVGGAACGRESVTQTPAGSDRTAAPSAEVAGGDLAVGAVAPAFAVVTHKGEKLSLASLRGKPVVLYFYPRDETPGCTREACALRDNWSEIEATGAVVIGVSGDDAASHRAFAEHHKLPFHLVTDDGALAKAFGVGFSMGFASRQSIVIGADGKIRKLLRDVNVATHAADVLAALR